MADRYDVASVTSACERCLVRRVEYMDVPPHAQPHYLRGVAARLLQMLRYVDRFDLYSLFVRHFH